MLHIIILGCLFTLLICSVYTDLKTGKIYNKITFPCMLLGLILNTLAYGWSGLLDGFAGMGIVLLVALLFASLSGIGGGDIKLLMASGAFLGFKPTLWAMAFSAIAGGVFAVAVAVIHGKLSEILRNIAMNVYMKISTKVPVNRTLDTEGGLKFKYSISIACGVILALLMPS